MLECDLSNLEHIILLDVISVINGNLCSKEICTIHSFTDLKVRRKNNIELITKHTTNLVNGF